MNVFTATAVRLLNANQRVWARGKAARVRALVADQAMPSAARVHVAVRRGMPPPPR